jgi:hypothetical protein
MVKRWRGAGVPTPTLPGRIRHERTVRRPEGHARLTRGTHRTRWTRREERDHQARRGLNLDRGVVIVINAHRGACGEQDRVGVREAVVVIVHGSVGVGGAIDADARRALTRGVQEDGVFYEEREGRAVVLVKRPLES